MSINTFAQLADAYSESEFFKELADTTRSAYSKRLNHLKAMGGKLPVKSSDFLPKGLSKKAELVRVALDRGRDLASRAKRSQVILRGLKSASTSQSPTLTAAWRDRIAQTYAEGGSRNNARAVLNSAYLWASANGFVASQDNPMMGFPTFAYTPKPATPFTRQEIDRIYAYPWNNVLRPYAYLVVLAFDVGGPRPAELIDVQTNHFHYEKNNEGERTLYICYKKPKGHNRQIAQARYAPVNERGKLILEWFTQQPVFFKNEHNMFRTSTGKQIEYTMLTKMFKVIMEKVGITEARTFYDTRRGVATTLDLEGRELREIKDLLGHARIATTERYMRPTAMQKAQRVRAT